jgi:hypothetical protein
MLLVVFGAGASFDSSPTYRPEHGYRIERPPLASDLFADRPRYASALKEYSECQPLVPHLRHPSPNQSVELLLQRYLEEAASDPVRHQQLAAIRYYLRRILGTDLQREWSDVHMGITNYKTLFEEIRHWRLTSGENVCLVTFNYDTMLEESVGVLGVNLQQIDDYVANDGCRIFKPHGSVHWMRELDTPIPIDTFGSNRVDHMFIERASALEISDRFRIWHGGSSELLRDDHSGKRIGLFPAIAIPVTTKSFFECPPAHLEILWDLLPKVTKILTIGWRAKERHFLDMLRQHPGHRCKVMVIASDQSEAKAISGELFEAGVGDNFTQAAQGFSNAILMGEIEQFLLR